MSFLSLSNVVKRFGDATVVDGVSLEAEKGELVVFVGPSGCGKSTLLRMIAGLEEVSDGRIEIDGRDVTDVEPAARQVSMVFQSYALFPHMSVRENMSFGLKMAKMPAAEIEPRVKEAARVLQIEPLLDRKPRQLSGGQRQRVAIGRAIVRKPKLFLFDEPLSNLDAELRTQMRVEIARLHEHLGVTMIYVTHDQVEAMTLADRIVVLREGRSEQIGVPTDLYDRPANSFVAGFIGSPKMNFLRAQIAASADGKLLVAHPAFETGSIALEIDQGPVLQPGDEVILGIRPEHLALGAGPATLTVTTELVENLGGSSHIHARSAKGEPVSITVPGHARLQSGSPLALGVDLSSVYLFTKEGLSFGSAQKL